MVMLFALSLMLAQAPSWEMVVPAAALSVPRVEISAPSGAGTCSSVVFDIDKDEVASALIAAHCVVGIGGEHVTLTVNGRNAYVSMVNSIIDLAIVRFKARTESAIVFATESPRVGTELAVIGYALGVQEWVAQFGRVAQTFNKESKAIWVDAGILFGDSGGALINAKGELIGVNNKVFIGGATLGGSIPIEAVKDFVDDWRDRMADAAKARK